MAGFCHEQAGDHGTRQLDTQLASPELEQGERPRSGSSVALESLIGEEPGAWDTIGKVEMMNAALRYLTAQGKPGTRSLKVVYIGTLAHQHEFGMVAAISVGAMAANGTTYVQKLQSAMLKRWDQLGRKFRRVQSAGTADKRRRSERRC